ncbi:hypothetical protein C8Q77DRAFT_824085 [Trametes polyzona]|nr:hypothetical protein C8Q77DRAFT_824085 [Trametes polyzona]
MPQRLSRTMEAQGWRSTERMNAPERGVMTWADVLRPPPLERGEDYDLSGNTQSFIVVTKRQEGFACDAHRGGEAVDPSLLPTATLSTSQPLDLAETVETLAHEVAVSSECRYVTCGFRFISNLRCQ